MEAPRSCLAWRSRNQAEWARLSWNSPISRGMADKAPETLVEPPGSFGPRGGRRVKAGAGGPFPPHVPRRTGRPTTCSTTTDSAVPRRRTGGRASPRGLWLRSNRRVLPSEPRSAHRDRRSPAPKLAPPVCDRRLSTPSKVRPVISVRLSEQLRGSPGGLTRSWVPVRWSRRSPSKGTPDPSHLTACGHVPHSYVRSSPPVTTRDGRRPRSWRGPTPDRCGRSVAHAL